MISCVAPLRNESGTSARSAAVSSSARTPWGLRVWCATDRGEDGGRRSGERVSDSQREMGPSPIRKSNRVWPVGLIPPPRLDPVAAGALPPGTTGAVARVGVELGASAADRPCRPLGAISRPPGAGAAPGLGFRTARLREVRRGSPWASVAVGLALLRSGVGRQRRTAGGMPMPSLHAGEATAVAQASDAGPPPPPPSTEAQQQAAAAVAGFPLLLLPPEGGQMPVPAVECSGLKLLYAGLPRLGRSISTSDSSPTSSIMGRDPAARLISIIVARRSAACWRGQSGRTSMCVCVCARAGQAASWAA